MNFNMAACCPEDEKIQGGEQMYYIELGHIVEYPYSPEQRLQLHRRAGIFLLIFGLIVLVRALTSPVDVKDMTVVRGTFESYIKNSKNCGTGILNVRLEDGTLAAFWDNGSPIIKELETNKGEMLTMTILKDFWTCKGVPQLAQIQSKGYQRFYDKKHNENIRLITICCSIVIIIFSLVVIIKNWVNLGL